MQLVHSKNSRIFQGETDDDSITRLSAPVSPESLCGFVDALAYPRHYVAEAEMNRRARDFIGATLTDFGFAVSLTGKWDNVLACGPQSAGKIILLAAHYDTVPGCPGADDNASAVAVCLECARILSENDRQANVGIVVFNREEDGLMGSREFVRSLPADLAIQEAHVFEMVGYCSHTPGSQRLPEGLPIAVPEVGDFLAVLANQASSLLADDLLRTARTYLPNLPVLALQTFLGVEKHFPHLLRSDHAPFWEAGIPALMWTDTSEFRNPHYHRASDTPDTLNYAYLSAVTRLALSCVLSRINRRSA